LSICSETTRWVHRSNESDGPYSAWGPGSKCKSNNCAHRMTHKMKALQALPLNQRSLDSFNLVSKCVKTVNWSWALPTAKKVRNKNLVL
jgi:hypothetical protein